MKKILLLLFFFPIVYAAISNDNINIDYTFSDIGINDDSLALTMQEGFTSNILNSSDANVSIGLWYLIKTVFDKPIVGVTEENIGVSQGSSGSTYTAGKKSCNIEFSDKNIYLSYTNLRQEIRIINNNSYLEYTEFVKPNIPTVFGSKNIIALSENYFYLKARENKSFFISIEDIKSIKENTTVIMPYKSGLCVGNITIFLEAPPPIYYDVKVSVDHLLYTQGETINATISIENKGVIPDKDTILSVFMIEPNGIKNQLSRQIMKSVDIGETVIPFIAILPKEASNGLYRIEALYETEEQGVLKASTSFFVTNMPKKVVYSIIYLAIILAVLVFLPLYMRKRKNES